MENTKQPFNWELYQSGKYEAVYRDRNEKIISITPDPMPSETFKFIARDEEGYEWYITSNGHLFSDDYKDENDVMLIQKSTA